MLHAFQMFAAPYGVLVAGSAATAAEVSTGSDTVDLLASAGVGAVALVVAYLMLKRSDKREQRIADEERKEHAETQRKLDVAVAEVTRLATALARAEAINETRSNTKGES